MSEFVTRSHEVPLPKTEDEIFALIKRILGLPRVMEFKLTPKSVQIRRSIRPDEEVLPEVTEEVAASLGVKDLIKTLEMDDYPFDRAEHPFHAFMNALRLINSRGLHATHVIAQDAEMFAAWLNLPWIPQSGEKVMGLRALFDNSEDLADKVLFLGSVNNTGFLTDAVLGVVVDMGV